MTEPTTEATPATKDKPDAVDRLYQAILSSGAETPLTGWSSLIDDVQREAIDARVVALTEALRGFGYMDGPDREVVCWCPGPVRPVRLTPGNVLAAELADSLVVDELHSFPVEALDALAEKPEPGGGS